MLSKAKEMEAKMKESQEKIKNITAVGVSGSNSIKVTIALLQWTNPHIYIWGYVEDDSEESGYKLWGFQAGSITMMARAGWTKEGTVEVGEEVTIEYFPIKDGSAGGEVLSMIHADGTVTDGDQPPKNWFRIMQEAQNGDGL